jgi:hypothetical protein
MLNSNFILKVTDAKLSDIRKALQDAGIQVRSIIEVFREEITSSQEEKNHGNG